MIEKICPQFKKKCNVTKLNRVDVYGKQQSFT